MRHRGRGGTTSALRNGYTAGFDLDVYFMHDIPADLASQMYAREVPQSDRPFADACAFDAWPTVPMYAVAGRDDRFFPPELQRRVARERLGVDPDIVPGGHLAAPSHPAELAAVLSGHLGPA